MTEIFLSLQDRQFLQAMREIALKEADRPGISENWTMAYLDIAKAMDHLDAMIARAQASESQSIIKPATIQPHQN